MWGGGGGGGACEGIICEGHVGVMRGGMWGGGGGGHVGEFNFGGSILIFPSSSSARTVLLPGDD